MKMVGTIITIGDFLKKDDTNISILQNDNCNTEIPVINLVANRKYVIPDYQREIRWQKENLIELISDINSGEKFLGNIILNKRAEDNYEVIDGQQRITILIMILEFIRHKFFNQIEVLTPCPLEIASFTQFPLFMEKKFDFAALNADEQKAVENSDIFHQRERYKELWNSISFMDVLNNSHTCLKFLTNLRRSEINLIVNTRDNDNYSIGYFLDVNLKGVKLDTEDIFKGYLFSHDSSSDIRDAWKSLKVLCFRLNEKTTYPTVKVIEHFLYCDLYKKPKYASATFGEDFLIDHEIEIDGIKHYSGEHIINVINDNAYMLNALQTINRFLKIVLTVVESESPNDDFKKLFNRDAKVDNNETRVIHNFIKKIMLDNNVIPKILIMKYVLETLLDQDKKTHEHYDHIYGAYLLAVLFTVFESDKNVKKILSAIKDENWYKKTVEQATSYFSKNNISKSRITAQYKLLNENDFENYMFRCKSLATIYNYFCIREQKIKIRNGQYNELIRFITDNELYTNEHFIINEGNSYIINEKNSSVYPKEIKKYSNSIFNFIFIKRQYNEDLKNLSLPKKLEHIENALQTDPEYIKCPFSKMVIETARDSFNCMNALFKSTPEETTEEFRTFYAVQFVDLFSDYALKIIKNIADQLNAGL